MFDFVVKGSELGVPDQRVQRHMHVNAAGVAVRDGFFKRLAAEVRGVPARVERGGAEINGVRSASDRRDKLLLAPGGRKYFN